MYSKIRPLLFALPPEQAHRLSLQALAFAAATPLALDLLHALCSAPPHPVEVAGLRFPNPLGVAAGYDKDGLAWRALASLGFGHVEVGTVCPRPQPGNPAPRVFRLPEDRSVINRLGFPSDGADRVRARLTLDRPHGLVLGVNLGKNKDTPLEHAAADYVLGVHHFAALADYLVINVSSPNTAGLRSLQHKAALLDILHPTLQALRPIRQTRQAPLPLFVKIAPDLDDHELDDAIDAILTAGADGIIATNTTISRDGLASHHRNEHGGLSGAPLTLKSRHLVRKLRDRVGPHTPIIGVGGIMNPHDAAAMLDAGADLIQLYTGLIYAGPALARDIVRGL